MSFKEENQASCNGDAETVNSHQDGYFYLENALSHKAKTIRTFWYYSGFYETLKNILNPYKSSLLKELCLVSEILLTL